MAPDPLPTPAPRVDPLQARTARWVRLGIVIAAVGYLAVGAAGLASGHPPALDRWIEIATGLTCAAALALARRRPRLAASLVLALVFAEVAWSMQADGAAAGLAVIVLPLLVLGAGIFVGGAGALVAAGASTALYALWLALGHSILGKPLYELVVVAANVFGTAAIGRAALRAYAEAYADSERAARHAEEMYAERRRLDEQLRHAQRLESVGLLAGGVAHDFNNLLTAVGGNAAVLATHADPEVRELAAEIKDAQSRGAALTRQLLAFARREARLEERLDLAEVAGGVRRLAARLLGEKHPLVLEVVGPAHVRADRGQLEQILLNLLSNARDAMPGGGEVLVKVAVLDAPAARALGSALEGRQVLLEVRDRGVGMSPEVRGRLFEPFFTTKPRGQGTGLGLATVHGIVAQSSGHVAVESAPGAGSSFRVFLPEAPSAPGEVTPVPGPVKALGGREAILLVEDDAHVRALAHRVLARAGYRVTAASNGGEALAFYDAAAPQLLLSDVAMPGLDGFELAARLREKAPTLKVLFMSGYFEPGGGTAGGALGGKDVLAKPFQPEELLRRVRHVLDA